jgi:hypothetical protein
MKGYESRFEKMKIVSIKSIEIEKTRKLSCLSCKIINYYK